MKQLGLHINELEKLMNEKGYDGHFLCNSSFPGKLRESLYQHLLDVMQGETHIRPFYLTTYSLWKDEESPYVQCDFRVRYDRSDGFRIDKMQAKYANHFSTIRNFETRIMNSADLPAREKVNSLVCSRKRSMRL